MSIDSSGRPRDGVCGHPRLFALYRHHDVSGVSGTGLVAYGTTYPPPGAVTIYWLGRTTGHPSIGVYDSLAAVEAIHGHHGHTEVVWLTPAGGPVGA